VNYSYGRGSDIAWSRDPISLKSIPLAVHITNVCSSPVSVHRVNLWSYAYYQFQNQRPSFFRRHGHRLLASCPVCPSVRTWRPWPWAPADIFHILADDPCHSCGLVGPGVLRLIDVQHRSGSGRVYLHRISWLFPSSWLRCLMLRLSHPTCWVTCLYIDAVKLSHDKAGSWS